MDVHGFAKASIEIVLEQLTVDPVQGLQADEIALRQKIYGKNILKQSTHPALSIFYRQLQSPFFYLLGGAAFLSIVLGQTTNAVLITLFVFINVLFGFYQEYHAEKTIADLRTIIAPKTTVCRDGLAQEVVTAELVPGDIVYLEPGDVLAADCRIIEAFDLLIDESVLTGESVPNRKMAAIPSTEEGLGCGSIVYAGTTVVTGTGVAVVIATGSYRSLGKLVEEATSIKRESLFARNIRTFTLLMMGLILVTMAGLVLLHTMFRASSMALSEILIFAIALALSILPEGLPMVMTFCLAQGAARLAKQRVVVKRLSAIEDLGSITTLCSDKTGTLTENSLSVAAIYGPEQEVMVAAMQVNQQLLVDRKDAARSFDDALIKKFQAQMPPGDRLLYLPFDHQHYCSHALVAYPDETVAYIRGVVEKIAQRCQPFDAASIEGWIHEQGRLGRRTIAVASKIVSSSLTVDLLVAEQAFTFIGAISFEDPIKESVVDAIAKAQTLGLSIKLVTGDSVDVAGAVAYKIGLITDSADVVSEDRLRSISDDKKLAEIQHSSVFADMSPHHKYELVQALEAVEQVGFLGEGINDAPALKMAHVALAVDNATDIAKDAADFILLDRSLSVIVDGIAEGRRIVANTIKYIQLMLICNTSNFYSLAIASLMIDFLPMTPLQILLVNVLSDFPLIAIATDHVVIEDIAKPQQYNFSQLITKALVFGIIGSIFDFVFFGVFYNQPKVLQTLWFMFCICSELVMFYVIRTERFFLFGHRPPLLLLLLSATSCFITLTLPLTSIGQSFFGFIRPTANQYLFFAALLVLWPLAMELVKIGYRRGRVWLAEK
ncbi:HAD-IC family P-type ATPase [Candidatus Dependentiae bacterium]|nr:HAD-IC family P-type ATPase [Candidatus Dependentiae bacterium]